MMNLAYLIKQDQTIFQAHYFSDSSGSSTEMGPTVYTNFGPPPFKTPPKLLEVLDVLADHPGTGVANLRNLAISLAKDAIFGKDEMMRCSLSGRRTLHL